jgi:hypothetical protein
MGILGDAIGRSGEDGSAATDPCTPAAPAVTATDPPAPSVASGPPAASGPSVSSAASSPSATPSTPQDSGRTELRRKRDALAEQVTELHWDLGGLAYEMAIRDHFRLDVLVRRAAVLQERDAELAEIERLLRLEESASAGACPHCAAPHSRGALFCWQCGATLMERVVPTAAALPAQTDGEEDRPTAVMDALLVSETVRAPEVDLAARDGQTLEDDRAFEIDETAQEGVASEAGGVLGSISDDE